MNFHFHPEASQELDDAYQWYETQQSGVGQRFIFEVQVALHRIQGFPHLGNPIDKEIRRALLPDFPYGIMYSSEDDLIEIFAFAHLHRKPFYWKKRKPS